MTDRFKELRLETHIIRLQQQLFKESLEAVVSITYFACFFVFFLS